MVLGWGSCLEGVFDHIFDHLWRLWCLVGVLALRATARLLTADGPSRLKPSRRDVTDVLAPRPSARLLPPPP